VTDSLKSSTGTGRGAHVLTHSPPQINTLIGKLHDDNHQHAGDSHGGHQFDKRETTPVNGFSEFHGQLEKSRISGEQKD
jgi:hypothetical protein